MIAAIKMAASRPEPGNPCRANRMTSLPPLREVIALHGLSASKALGQNFLLDEQLLDRIATIPGKFKRPACL